MTTDLKAVHYVLFNNYDYQKPEVGQRVIRILVGNGVFCCITWGDTLMTLLLFYIGLVNVEGDEHKHQVQFLFQDLFPSCCLIQQVAQDFGRLC